MSQPPSDDDSRDTHRQPSARTDQGGSEDAGQRTEQDDESGGPGAVVEETADAARRARGALAATIAERAAESSWLDHQLDRVATVLQRYERWAESPEQTQIDLWAAQLSGWFRAREDRFAGLRRAANQARVEESYDLYLGRAATYAGIAAGVGAMLGVALTMIFAQAGVFAAIDPHVAAPAALARVVSKLRVPLLGTLITVVLASIFGGIVFAGLYSLPYLQRRQRASAIDLVLPYAVTHLYALSRGNLPLVTIIRHLSESSETYGVLAEEFSLVVRQMDYFGRDLRGALREARVQTPSETYADFLDDLGTVLDTGGNLTPFLGDMTDSMHDEARRSQEAFLETLEIFAEMYVVSMVVAPLLIVTILVALGSIQTGIFSLLPPVIYGYIPIGTIAFWFFLEALRADEPEATAEALAGRAPATTADDIEATLAALTDGSAADMVTAAQGGNTPGSAGDCAGSGPGPDAGDGGGGPPTANGGQGPTVAPTDGAGGGPVGGEIPTTERRLDADRQLLGDLAHALRRERVISWLRAPLTRPRHRPRYVLGWSVPLALLVLLGVLGTGTATLAHLTARPVWATTILGVIPFVVAATPLTYYHERHRRRRERVNQELPTILRQLGSANQAGLTLHKAIGVVGETASGRLAREFRRLDAALAWNVGLDEALAELSGRLRNPRVTRVVSLLIEGSTAARDIGPLLDAIEADARNAAKLDRDRRQDTLVYQFLTVIGFLVFLGILAMMLAQLLPALAEAQQAATAVSVGGSQSLLGGQLSLTRMYRLLYHAALVQAVASGLMAGQLGHEDALAGLKIALIQVLLTVVVFVLV